MYPYGLAILIRRVWLWKQRRYACTNASDEVVDYFLVRLLIKRLDGILDGLAEDSG